jgi:hypothetical protein
MAPLLHCDNAYGKRVRGAVLGKLQLLADANHPTYTADSGSSFGAAGGLVSLCRVTAGGLEHDRMPAVPAREHGSG